MRHTLLDRGGIECGDRIAASRKADKLAGVGQFRRRLGNFNFTTNGSCSKAPNGPFQTNVLLRANTETIGDADDLGSIRETGGSIRTMKKRKLTV